MSEFKGKTVFITGASRGIGKAIGLKLAGAGANIIVTGKTDTPHPKLPGTIHTAAAEMEAAGGQALAVVMDVRDDASVARAVDAAVERFGGIDILINNASAIMLAPTEHLPMKRYDLIQNINTRGTFLSSKLCIPHLRAADNPHILTLSPPISLKPEFLGPHLGYTISKYGMSMCALGLAAELKKDGIASNALWPQTTIATAAVNNLLGGADLMRRSRQPAIVADAAYHILRQPSREYTGQCLIDEDVLRANGISDFGAYAVEPGAELQTDLFL
jgi:citronellol/citronellal dehydrogenase